MTPEPLMETSNAASLASQRLLHGRLGQWAGQAYEQEVDRLVPRLLARGLQLLEPATLQRSWELQTQATPPY